MKFKYKAVNNKGEIIQGLAEARDKFELARQLGPEGKKVIWTKPLGETLSLWARLGALAETVATVSIKERIFFANNLSEMVSAGLALSRALGVIERESSNKKFKKIVKEIEENINRGGSLAEGLAQYPRVFSLVFVAMVEAGERSGRLPQSLKIVSEQLEKSYELRRRIIGALIYPAIIILVMVAMGILMMIFVVPTLAEVFGEIGAELPLTTRILIGSSNFIVANGLWVSLAVLVFVIGLFGFFRQPVGKRIWASLLLRLPIFGKITRQLNSAVTARTIASLISSGVEIVKAINITEDVLQNPYYKEVMKTAAVEIPKGQNLSAVFEKSAKLYPVFVAEMTLVGEETGKVPEMLTRLAIFYENEVDSVTKNLSTVIEPVLMILIGAAVGFFALSMIQPIYSIGSQI